MEIDPATVRPMAGKILVQIVEVLGGMTKGGVFVPPQTQDHMGKDTFYGKVLQMGSLPTTRLSKRDERGMAQYKACDPWPQDYRVINQGDVVVFPRDVPLAFTWEQDRYALVLEHEAILAIPGDQFDAQGFQVVPWRPPVLPDQP
jgi:co-chaperonin GroES (HSP10)